MQRTNPYSLSYRAKQSIGLLLCVCIVITTLISATSAAFRITTMASNTQSNMLPIQHGQLRMDNHAMHYQKNIVISKAPFDHTNTEQNNEQHYSLHEAPCDNCDHQAKSGCPESCTVNLCCTAPGLSNISNLLELNRPELADHYLTSHTSRIPDHQSSLVLRPPIT